MTRISPSAPMPRAARASASTGASLRRLIAALVATAAAGTALTACVPIVMVGAAVGGSMMVTDRRSAGTQIEDEGIELKAGSRVREVVGNLAHVNTTSFNRTLLITGEVPDDYARASVARVTANIENVKTVVNEVIVGPASSLATRSEDSAVTTKVKATLLDKKDVFGTSIKVVTERGTVYLMGRVTEAEAVRATDLTSRIAGVKKVVRVFDIISEAERNSLVLKPVEQTDRPALQRP
jgi:osmotically-inducible protein OsmY